MLSFHKNKPPPKQRLLRLDAPPVRLKVLNNASGVIKPVRAIFVMVVVAGAGQ